MNPIQVRCRSDGDGILHLDVPVSFKEAEYTITIELTDPDVIGQQDFNQTYGSYHNNPTEYEDLDELL